MTNPLSLPAPMVLLVLSIPIAYVGNGFTPWAKGLWARGDRSYYVSFWASVSTLHWVSAGLVVELLSANNHTLADVGLGVPSPTILASTAVVAALAVGGYVVVVLRSAPIPRDVLDMPRHGAIPATTPQRVLYLGSSVVSAAVCEELVYRGVAISALVGLGVHPLVAVAVASLSFVFVHGIAPIRKPPLFVVYFIVGAFFSSVFLLSGSLIVAMVVHGAVNATQAIHTTRSLATETPDRPASVDSVPAEGR